MCTDTKVLWDNIVYNPATQTLAWEPACPVLVMVNLCRLMKSNDHCEDIQNSSKNSSEKVRAMQIYSNCEMEGHDQRCNVKT